MITGGARGIGRAIAERYADEGARVVIADILEAEASATADAIGRGAFGLRLDVTDQASIDAMVKAVVDRAGRIDISTTPPSSTCGAAPRGHPRGVGPQFRHHQGALLHPPGGRSVDTCRPPPTRPGAGKVINMASQAGRRGEPLVSAYCASKAAVISLTQSAAKALIPHRVNVNGIAPGVVDTAMDEVDRLFAKYENPPIGEKKRQVGEAVPFAAWACPRTMSAPPLPRLRRCRLRAGLDAQCRRRQLDELRRSRAMPFTSASTPTPSSTASSSPRRWCAPWSRRSGCGASSSRPRS
ncbi:MAG: SDR family NAD(P)-dependent oxidoreductase [Geminicoccaceae bacterium]